MSVFARVAVVCLAALGACAAAGAPEGAMGRLKLFSAGKDLPSVKVETPPLGESFSVEFKARRTKLYPVDQHFGITFKGGAGDSLMIYTRGDKVNRLEKEHGEETAHNTVGDIKQMDAGADAAWKTFKIFKKGDHVEIDGDNNLVGVFKTGLKSVEGVSFYSYRVDVEIDSVRIERSGVTAPAAAAPLSGVAELRFPFDGALDGGGVSPEKRKSVSFVEGVNGKAVFAGGSDTGRFELEYQLPGMLAADKGSLMFWFRPDWDGKFTDPERFPCYFFLSGLDAAGKVVFSAWMWNWLRFDTPRQGELQAVSVESRVRGRMFKGDWHHVAFSWDNSGWTAIYVDGKKGTPQRHFNLDMSKIKSLVVGADGYFDANSSARSAIDELVLRKAPLTEGEVAQEYRKHMPVDMVLDDTTLLAGKDLALRLLVAPVGHYTLSGPLKDGPAGEASLRLSLVVEREADGQRLFEKAEELKLAGPVAVPIPLGELPRGCYRLLCSVEGAGGKLQRSLPFRVHPLVAANAASGAAAKTSPPAREVDFFTLDASKIPNEGGMERKSSAAGNYLEAGRDNGNRLGVELPFPEELLGKPVELEVEWPDDKARSMALYMYPESKSPNHRDRLDGGVQSGGEYPLTHKMQRTRYLFYPGVRNYLFEARTMVGGMPAAVSKLRILPVDGRLPKLEIAYPKGLPARNLGHLDEDQTFDIMLNYDDPAQSKSPFRSALVLEKLCDYFDYTGQNMFDYPVLRYGDLFYPLEGSGFGWGLFPYSPGEIPLVAGFLNGRGMKFSGIMNCYTLPELSNAPDKAADFERKGYVISDDSGKRLGSAENPRANHANPEIRKLFLAHVAELCSRYGKLPGFDGLDWWIGNFGSYHGLNEGYDDYTVALFARETGVAIPGSASFKGRHDFLTTQARDKWVAWRAAQTTEFVRQVRETMDKFNPGLALTVSLVGAPLLESSASGAAEADLGKYYREECGVDLAALNQLKGVSTAPVAGSTSYRWAFHWNKPESSVDEVVYNPAAYAPFLKDGLARASVYPTYYETFRNSLMPGKYQAYFQNADVKPWGRYFLKSLVFDVAALDARTILIGAQPLGSWGRDEEIREFAKAYRALPALPFHAVEGMSDPVTARWLQTGDGTYVYAASMLWDSCEAKLKLSGAAELRDLSDGAILKADKDGIVAVPLKPYQLRSFLAAGEKAAVSAGGVVATQATKDFYAGRKAMLDAALRQLEASGLDVAKHKDRLAAAAKAIAEGRYAEAHRLLFSPSLNSLPKLLEANRQGYLKRQVEMIKANTYAVNCGSQAYDFHLAKNGKLFFPDQRFGGNAYGHDGNYQCVARDIVKMKPADDPVLFQTEAYDMDAYRFKVANGKYKVTFYFRVGYEPGAKPGNFVFDVNVEGKPALKGFDVFLESGAAGGYAIKTIHDVVVTDGVLDVEFSVPDGKDGSARLCNAIEVEPENA